MVGGTRESERKRPTRKPKALVAGTQPEVRTEEVEDKAAWLTDPWETGGPSAGRPSSLLRSHH